LPILSNPSIIICIGLARIFVNFENIINLLFICVNFLFFYILVSLLDFVDLRLLVERDWFCSNIKICRGFLVTGQGLEVLYIIRFYRDGRHIISTENKTELGYLVYLEGRETIETCRLRVFDRPDCNARDIIFGIIR
jgi:hypothetical protein